VKEKTKKLLWEFIKNSKRSDRELAKIMGVSQPTITRMRNKLVKEGIVKEWTVIPDFSKIGYELLAISCLKMRTREELAQKAREMAKARPNIIFSARAQGMGKNSIIVSMHRTYSEFSRFLSKLLSECGDDIEDYGTILVSLDDSVVKPFSFKHLVDLEEL
jgi:DNA-binding Lrp family transcriptional regulator